ncbi:MAG: alanine racemase [Lachnospiraceae bacterium]|nr:alanine racemase [Lachnospiraceae bacterium]
MNTEWMRIRVEIDLDRVLHNFNELTKDRPDCKAFSVIKADAYGHGAVVLAKLLQDQTFGFAVATADEAIELSDAGLRNPVLILGPVPKVCFPELIERGVRLTVFETETAETVSAVAKELGKPAFVHIKVDTGMSRVGLTPDEAGIEVLKHIRSLPGLVIEGVFTHFATMDMVSDDHAMRQADKFETFVRLAKEDGVEFPVIHLSNSAAILRKKRFPSENAIRLGIALYGVFPSDEVEYPADLQPVMSVISRITYVKTVPAGTAVSYGETFVSDREMQVATVSAGYADGIPRSLSNKAEVLVSGKRAKILGRICMDQFMIDVTGIPEAKPGDEVVILGKQGEEEITIYEQAGLSGRFPYEFLTDISKRVPRVYVGPGRS